jgi:hypothetical protein
MLEISLLALIGIGLGTMFFGYFFGLFEGRGQGYKKRKGEEASDPALRAALQATIPPPSPAAPAPAPAPLPAPVMQVQPQAKSLLRLSLDATQQPCLELDGQQIDTAQMEPPQRRRLIDLMVIMRPWIEAGPVARPPQPVAAAPDAAPVAAAAPAPQPAPAAPTRATGPLAAPAPADVPTAAPTTMVGQIDAILQGRIAGTPLAARGIRLVESMQGGAMVVVGLQRYAGVGDVPDPEIQAVIRAAIAEWEKKYTPS